MGFVIRRRSSTHIAAAELSAGRTQAKAVETLAFTFLISEREQTAELGG